MNGTVAISGFISPHIFATESRTWFGFDSSAKPDPPKPETKPVPASTLTK